MNTKPRVDFAQLQDDFNTVCHARGLAPTGVLRRAEVDPAYACPSRRGTGSPDAWIVIAMCKVVGLNPFKYLINGPIPEVKGK